MNVHQEDGFDDMISNLIKDLGEVYKYFRVINV